MASSGGVDSVNGTELPFDPDVTAILAEPWTGPEPKELPTAWTRPGPKVYPEIGEVCLRERKSRCYRLWTLARALDVQGRGRVDVARIRQTVNCRGQRGLAPGTVRRLLNAGNGTFWTVNYYADGRRWLDLHGLRRVCVALGVDKLRRDPVRVPWRYLKTLRAFRVALYSALFAGDKFSNPVSRAVIEKRIGYKARTQRYWQAAAGEKMAMRQNAALTSTTYAQWEELRQMDPEAMRGLFPDFLESDELSIFKRLPNSYRADLPRAARGMVRRVNQQLRSGNPVRQDQTGTRNSDRLKLYYTNQRGAQRKMQLLQGDEPFYLVQPGRGDEPVTTRGGAVVWSRWQIADRRLFCG